jgi:hypothetical protein
MTYMLYDFKKLSVYIFYIVLFGFNLMEVFVIDDDDAERWLSRAVSCMISKS